METCKRKEGENRMTSVTIKDNSDTVKKEVEDAIARSLKQVGLVCEGYAKELCPVDTGRLRNSIRHDVEERAVIISANTEYAGFVELGTSKHPDPQPYLRPALSDHIDEYKLLIQREFEKI